MDTTIIRELFFQNLLSLGLDKASIEKKYRITIDKDMFCVPNQKLFEVVTHFLFLKLNEVSSQKYVLPWPVLEKDQRRQFQKACFNHLSAIASESNVIFPHFVFSLFSTFSGDRFYELYLAFSNHVLQRTVIKKNNVSLIMKTSADQQNSKAIAEILKIDTILSVEKIQEVLPLSLHEFKILLKYSHEFQEQMQNLKLKFATNRSLLKKSIHTLNAIYCDDEIETVPSSVSINKSMKYNKKVQDLWKCFCNFFAKESELWECVCPQVSDNQDTFYVDGLNLINFVASDDIKKICPELNMISKVVGEEKEKLSVHKYLSSFFVILEFYSKTYVNSESLQVNELCYRKNISRLEENLNHIKSLNEIMAGTVLPSMKESTKNLKANILFPEDCEDFEDFIRQYPSMSYCSTQFQELLNSFRTHMLSSISPSGDVYNSSLLLDDYTKFLEDVSIDSGFGSLSRSTAEQSNSYLTNSFPVTELHHSNTLPNSEEFSDETQNPIQENKSELSLSFDFNFPEFESNSEKFSQNLIPDTSTKQISQEPHIFASTCCIEDFEIDIEYKKPYKLRESWQLEDSLNAMTLPDMPEFE